MSHGRGSEVWDESGKRYLDFIQGWAVNALGHAPEVVLNALQGQATRLLTASPAYHNRQELELSEKLCRLSGLRAATFCSSGAEAVETAIKLCRKWGRLHKRGAFGILSTHDAFHGRTLAAMSLSGKPGWDDLFPPNPPGFKKVPYGDLNAMANAIDERTVALCVEPVQGEAGAVDPPEGYLRGLRALADEHDLLLVFDEVQTGLFRTGSLFAFQQSLVLPDVVTLGKGLGAGVPLSAVLVTERANVFTAGDHGGTFNGNPLMAAVGNAVIDTMTRPDFAETVQARSKYLRDALESLALRIGGRVRGRGLLLGLVLSTPNAEAIRDACFERGLLVNAARPNVLRFMPELRVPEWAIDEMIGILESCLERPARHDGAMASSSLSA
jgi:acetylornithine/N-succinyldiaminopimelate aminotransferase